MEDWKMEDPIFFKRWKIDDHVRRPSKR